MNPDSLKNIADPNNLETINNSLRTAISVSFFDGLIILLASTIAGFVVRLIFFKYGESMSSKRGFGNTIILITISVAALIAVVKSSLALSLGLVGALSVIRFRTAIKEPYNLAFLLLAICIGISLGASQFRFALVITIVGSLVPFILKKFRNKIELNSHSNDIDSLNIELNSGTNLVRVYEILEKYTDYFSVKSISEDNNGRLDILIKLDIGERDTLEKLRLEIKDQFKDSLFSFYETPNK